MVKGGSIFVVKGEDSWLKGGLYLWLKGGFVVKGGIILICGYRGDYICG